MENSGGGGGLAYIESLDVPFPIPLWILFKTATQQIDITSISSHPKPSVLSRCESWSFCESWGCVSCWKRWYFSRFLCQKALAEGNCYGALDINTPRSSDGVRKLIGFFYDDFFPVTFWLVQHGSTKREWQKLPSCKLTFEDIFSYWTWGFSIAKLVYLEGFRFEIGCFIFLGFGHEI